MHDYFGCAAAPTENERARRCSTFVRHVFNVPGEGTRWKRVPTYTAESCTIILAALLHQLKMNEQEDAARLCGTFLTCLVKGHVGNVSPHTLPNHARLFWLRCCTN